MLILGVVGQIASGKGVLVKYLTEKLGFTSFSLSSIVHDEYKKRNIGVGSPDPLTRQTLQDIGDDLRKKEGDDVLAVRAIEKIKNEKLKIKNLIIDGIRNPGEIEFLKKNPNFIFIGVRAKRELRFKRLISRNKEWDPKKYEDFLKVDKRDLGLKEGKNGQQVGKCLGYSDYVINNNKDVVNFQRKVEKIMKKIVFNG